MGSVILTAPGISRGGSATFMCLLPALLGPTEQLVLSQSGGSVNSEMVLVQNILGPWFSNLGT